MNPRGLFGFLPWPARKWPMPRPPVYKELGPRPYQLDTSSVTTAEATRERLVERLRELLALPALATLEPPSFEVLESFDGGSFVRDKIVFGGIDDFRLAGYLFRPHDRTRTHPGVVVFHGHGYGVVSTAIDETLQGKALAKQLAGRGYVTLAYDSRHFGESSLEDRNTHRIAIQRGLLRGEPLAGRMVGDAIRAVGLLASLGEVDPERIGVAGLSMGGQVSLMTAVLDERVKATVVAGFLTQYAGLYSDSSCCFCAHVPGLGRDMEMVDMAASIAPRPVLYLIGQRDVLFPPEVARRLISDIEVAYSIHGCAGNLAFATHPGAHEMDAGQAMAWLDAQFKTAGDSAGPP